MVCTISAPAKPLILPFRDYACDWFQAFRYEPISLPMPPAATWQDERKLRVREGGLTRRVSFRIWAIAG